MKLSFSTLACPDWSYQKVISEAVAYGYEGVEWRLLDGNTLDASTPLAIAREVGEATRQAGLEVCALDSSLRLTLPEGDAQAEMLREARAMLKLAQEMGAEHLRVFLDDIPAGVTLDEAAEWTSANVNALGEAVTASGVRLAIELHNPFSAPVPGAPKVTSSQLAVRALEGVSNDAVGIQWDWGNPYLEDEEAAETWERIKSRLFYCHTKDLGPGAGGELVYVPMGAGIVPVGEIVSWLAKDDFDGWLSYEWEKKWHPDLAEPEVALPQYIEIMRPLLDRVAVRAVGGV